MADWLLNGSEIAPGASAVLGNNYVAFYSIHIVAIYMITISLLSCFVVLYKILLLWKNCKAKIDFPVRIPLYLALADATWGLSHLTDHSYLLTWQLYPNSAALIRLLGFKMWVFFGYQQLMHASIAVYTYLNVVHGVKPNVGKWEWKLHLTCLSFLLATSLFFYCLDSFGNMGYWMANNVTTTNGKFYGAVVATASTFNAFCTSFGYYCIRRRVLHMKANKQHMKHCSIIFRCLTTYVYIAACLYWPLAISLWINLFFQVCFNAIEPFSCLLIAIIANSSGWANTYGYFYNENLKRYAQSTRASVSTKAISGRFRLLDEI